MDIPGFSGKGIPQEVMDQAQVSADPLQKSLFRFLGSHASGKATWRTMSFNTPQDVAAWLNKNKEKAIPLSIIPDFQTFSYWLVYEEMNSNG